jgi:hypothetical protein
MSDGFEGIELNQGMFQIGTRNIAEILGKWKST